MNIMVKTKNRQLVPDYDRSYILASDLLKEISVVKLATPINEILYNYDIRYIPFSILEKYIPLNSPIFKTAGALSNLHDDYFIFYDDTNSISRIRWTQSHELGHFFLNHDFENRDNYDVYEKEANYFAAQLLMPFELLLMLEHYFYLTESLLAEVANTNKIQARHRINNYKQKKKYIQVKDINEDLMIEYDRLIRRKILRKEDYKCIMRDKISYSPLY